ncbi:MAG: heme-binding domain-containing protein, partial [Chloroflexi bacterium]|nr:heme-binding domain-containing protein [Chloroflexota bacterium]
MKRRWTKILAVDALLMIVTFGAIQLIPVPRDNPPVRREPVWNSAETRTLAVDACFDCHSSETEWPWYTGIAPFSWVVWYDVTEGREALDFSDWDRHVDDDFVDPEDA